MHIISLLVSTVGIALTGLPANAQGPSFDCNKAQTVTERAICSSSGLSALDRELARSYQAARKLLSAGGRQQLLDAQRAWLGQRNRCDADTGCLETAMRERINALGHRQAASQPAQVAASIAGAWQPVSRAMGASGTMHISGSELRFAEGSLYAIEPARAGGEVYRITHRSGPQTLACGSERTGYVSFWQHASGELVLNVFWDRGVPPNHPKQEPTQALPDRCIMSFYAR